MKISEDMELTSSSVMFAQLTWTNGKKTEKLELSLDQFTWEGGMLEVLADIQRAHESGTFRGWTLTTSELIKLAFGLGRYAYKQR